MITQALLVHVNSCLVIVQIYVGLLNSPNSEWQPPMQYEQALSNLQVLYLKQLER